VTPTIGITALAALMLLMLGAALWGFGEYTLHRFAMHSLKGRGIASREHLRHHAATGQDWQTEWLAWAGVILVGSAWAALAWLVVGPVGVMLGLGWVAAYGFYEWIHWRAHQRPVAHPYERWVRRHHFHHHFGHPLDNHGVTTPVWDLVFGTYERVDGPVRVPRRMAMVWLLDDDGEVRPEYAADYVVVGRKPASDVQADQDQRDAFANLAPAV
jgi:sterol desaturase/sphingolipid hydroxylase (fatty acid hydroxylase superfamily)